MTLRSKTKQSVRVAMSGGAFNLSGLLAKPDELDQLIDWKLTSPAIQRANGLLVGDEINTWKKGQTMQLTWTIELRCDMLDEGKLDAITKQVQAAARMLMGTASLISDKTPPRIAIYSDDVFAGNKEIQLFDNTIVQGQQQLAAIGGEGANAEEPLSQELLDALK